MPSKESSTKNRKWITSRCLCGKRWGCFGLAAARHAHFSVPPGRLRTGVGEAIDYGPRFRVHRIQPGNGMGRFCRRRYGNDSTGWRKAGEKKRAATVVSMHAFQASTKVSCARSSARAFSPQSEMACRKRRLHEGDTTGEGFCVTGLRSGEQAGWECLIRLPGRLKSR